MIQFMIWMFRQRGKRTNHYENTVVKDAFADDKWDGKKHTLKKRILEIGDNDHLEAFERLVKDYQLYCAL